VKIYSYSIKTKQKINRFLYSNKINSKHNPLQKKMDLCEYKIILISTDQSEYNKIKEFDYLELPKLFHTWGLIRGVGKVDSTIQTAGWKIIEQIGLPFYWRNGSKNSILWKFNHEKAKDIFFILLSGVEQNYLPRYELLFLSNLWQVMNGSLPVHGSGVIHKGSLFLFTGRSGTGKSTIAKSGLQMGDQVLDEDQVLVKFSNNGLISAHGWGFDVIPNKLPITAVFNILQDKSDWISPIRRTDFAQLITERSYEILGNLIPDEGMRHLLTMSSKIARQIPGYDLHFRKSTDFWKLIDAEFGLD